MKKGEVVRNIDVDVVGAPHEKQWLTLLEFIHKHAALGSDGLKSVGGGKRCRQMVICASQAMSRRHQKHLKKCKCISLARDARAPRINVRYVGTSPPPLFKIMSGLLGSHRDPEPGALGVLKATKAIINRFSTFDKKYSKSFD